MVSKSLLSATFRDIGTNLNLSAAPNGKTLSDRTVKAIAMAKRLRWFAIPQKFKEQIVKANILPAGLYGVEASWANSSTLKSLKAAIANALGPRSARASSDMVFVNTSCSGDLDPEIYILSQRVQAIRRIIAKYPSKQSKVQSIVGKYLDGSCKQATISNPVGPVGLLMHSVEQMGAKITPDLRIVKDNEADIDILHMPWQHLKKATVELAANKRAVDVTDQRSHLKGLNEIDNQIVKKIINRLGDKEARVYNHISTGGAWSEAHLQDIGLSESGTCTHCGGEVHDISHVLWSCPVVNKHRKVEDLNHLDPQLLPTYIKHGVPAAMSSNIESTFWGQVEQVSNEQASADTLKAIGIPTTNRGKVVASCKNQEVKDVLATCNINPASNNARQAFQQIKANKQKPHLAMPYRCTRLPPADINVYTDGS